MSVILALTISIRKQHMKLKDEILKQYIIAETVRILKGDGNMDKLKVGMELMNCFPNSYINAYGEFIASDLGNEYFILDNCKDELEVKCKMLEWLSRGAFKDEPSTPRKNAELHKFMLAGINDFLGTEFTESDMEKIYIPLGNECNRKLCIEFIKSGYDMSVLERR